MQTVQLNPVGWMSQLSQWEVDLLQNSTDSDLYQIFRNCCLAVLNSGVEKDDPEQVFGPYQHFDVRLVRRERGVKIELVNPPPDAFVDGKLIKGVHEHLFAVLRDLLYMGIKYDMRRMSSLAQFGNQTDMVFDFLRHSDAISGGERLNLVVCWGGHSINTCEYEYTKDVGYQLGLREMNICTGCGPGAMKGPMKGAAIGHAKQRYRIGRYLGVTEPSIIAAEPPNAIVNELVIMPDIEKRLEAFVRIAHGIVIFPGGVGTAEELLYILGIMLDEQNAQQRLPIVLTGPAESADYFHSIDTFVANTLGEKAQRLYKIIIDDPSAVAHYISTEREQVEQYRREMGDSFNFNWSLKIAPSFQAPFVPTHDSMAELDLHTEQPTAELAAALRKAFSGIVAGNVKGEGIRQIREKGPFQLSGEPRLMEMMDNLLRSFALQHRMKLPGSTYVPCYEITR
ncbi:nucleotide 5'-monophosphate nucleosidase PpnN [Aestuariibacter salexigens]|uniref:nucleotide 5'-monophosphate nucleosidase PpnN n=1 Tax=Aestuariibacter salexigens TaxID=226010 RepID=UPI0003F94A7C|nr:nucleotide 5'-monophosphate nucleosidase PpnN [Aestuariibacter salexigens]